MWFSDKGIVIHKIKYSDSASIVRIFCETSGYKSFLVRGMNSKKNKLNPHFQPMSLLDFQVRIRGNKDLHNIKDVRFHETFPNASSDFRKSSVLLFMAEVLYRTLQDDYENRELYEYLYKSLEHLNKTGSISTFSIQFLLGLSGVYGFYPEDNYSASNLLFDLQSGSFVNNKSHSDSVLSRPESEDLHVFLGTIFVTSSDNKLTTKRRFELLLNLIRYFKHQIEGMRDVKSHYVLKEVFDL